MIAASALCVEAPFSIAGFHQGKEKPWPVWSRAARRDDHHKAKKQTLAGGKGLTFAAKHQLVFVGMAAAHLRHQPVEVRDASWIDQHPFAIEDGGLRGQLAERLDHGL
jgi:hypothetical protein